VAGFLGFIVLYTALRLATGQVLNASTVQPIPPSFETAVDLVRSTFFEQF
jgi:hypothetical protein